MDQYCAKSVCISKFSGPYSPRFGLNKELFSVNIRFQSECGKIRTRKTRNSDTLQYKVQINLKSHDLWNVLILFCFRYIMDSITKI